MAGPKEIRALISKAGLSQRQAAFKIGIDDRTVRRYCSENDPLNAPKVVMLALEYLAKEKERGN